jgi:general stress protein 26
MHTGCDNADTFRREGAKVKGLAARARAPCPNISRHHLPTAARLLPLGTVSRPMTATTSEVMTMADKTVAKNQDESVPTDKKLDDLYDLIDGIEIAMFTTRRADGQLVSRPMQMQERTSGVDLWFMTNVETHKLDDLMTDPHVNLAFYKDGSREWVSVAGLATVSNDPALIEELYKPDWKAWLGDEGGDRDGSPTDPRIALILVEAESVTYMKVTKPRPVVLFEVAKAMVTGSPPNVGSIRTVSDREIQRGADREAR